MLCIAPLTPLERISATRWCVSNGRQSGPEADTGFVAPCECVALRLQLIHTRASCHPDRPPSNHAAKRGTVPVPFSSHGSAQGCRKAENRTAAEGREFTRREAPPARAA